MDCRLDGAVALVTGGSQGIGRAVAVAMAQAGAAVMINHFDPDDARAQDTVDTVASLTGQAAMSRGDVSAPEYVDDLIEATIQTFGALDILVNNAGVTLKNAGTFVEQDRALWRRVIDVNLGGTLYCTQAAVRAMLAAGHGGCVLSMSSIHALLTSASGITSPYPATKAAISMFTRSLAVELAPQGIRVNAIAPGLIPTEGIGNHSDDMLQAYYRRIPMGRAGTPEEVANLAVFLASDQAAYITGQTVMIDGGYSVDGTLTELRAPVSYHHGKG